jgi:hypothetical protein
LLINASLFAQNQYTVEVGAFQDATQQDFAELSPLGFVYGSKLSPNVTQVYLGTFDALGQAEATATQLRARGFKNARVLQRPAGRNAVMIQLATKLLNAQLDYASLSKAGNVFVEQVDDRLKVMTGAYADLATAQANLAAVRQLGYKDAFVKTLDFNRLIPISTFETGIKEPLIPIQLNEPSLGNNPPMTNTSYPAQPNTYNNQPMIGNPAIVNPGEQPRTYNNTSVNPTAGTILAKSVLPNIRSRFKRESASMLQTVLKEKGYYTGLIDGYYGDDTQTAYAQAWANQKDLLKYRTLVPLLTIPSNDPVLRWPATASLMAVSKDMSGGLEDVQLAGQSAGVRQQLYATTQPLTPSVSTRAKNWSATLWANLDAWATEDPVHARMESAFRLAYYQTQVLLEDYYMDKGFAADAAKDLALTTLQNIVGADLERFLY